MTVFAKKGGLIIKIKIQNLSKSYNPLGKTYCQLMRIIAH